MTPAGRFRAVLESGRFVLTCELECPRGASAANVARQTRAYAPHVDAIACTDNSAAVARMSPVAAAALVARAGALPLVYLTARDRNRLALQSEILGAAAVGAAGIVCMSGDPPAAGNHPDARAVNDLASVGLIAAVRTLCGGRFLSGDPVVAPPNLVAGAVATPADDPAVVERVAAKVEAGAAFLLTQVGYDVDLLGRWLDRLRRRGLTGRVRVLAGVAPIRRPTVARFLRDRVEGAAVPAEVVARIEAAADPEAEGVRLAAAYLRGVRRLPGIAGAHIMTFGWAEGVSRVLAAEAAV